MKPRLPLLYLSIVGLSLLLWALPGGLAPAAVSAAPAGGLTKVFLPLVIKPPPPLIVSALQLAANTGPNCASFPWDFEGPSPLVVSGQVTQIYIRADIQNGLGKPYRFEWFRNNAYWTASTGTISSNYDYVHTFAYSSNTLPCTGHLPKETYRLDLYVDGVFQQTGTIIVQ